MDNCCASSASGALASGLIPTGVWASKATCRNGLDLGTQRVSGNSGCDRYALVFARFGGKGRSRSRFAVSYLLPLGRFGFGWPRTLEDQRELPDLRHLHSLLQPTQRPRPEGSESERLRSSDGPGRQRASVAPHRQEQGPQFLVGARQSRHPPDCSQNGREPAGRLCRPPRRRLCLGRTPADRGASTNRRGPDRRGARARGGSRPAIDVRLCFSRAGQGQGGDGVRVRVVCLAGR